MDRRSNSTCSTVATATSPGFTWLFSSEYIEYRTALVWYWLNILLLGAVLLISWRYAKHANVIKADAPNDADTAVERRILMARALYTVSAAFCFVDTYVSIALIVLVQLNYAIAPRLGI